MTKLRILLIIFAADLSTATVTGQNFTLSDAGLMSLDWFGSSTAILLEKTDVPGPGVRFVIEYQGNQIQDQSFRHISHENHGAGSLTGIDVSIYDYYQLKFTLLSIDGDTNPDTSAVLGVGALIGPYDDHSSAYDPEGLDFAPDPQYGTSAISSTPVRLDNTPSLIGFVAYLPWLEQWSPSGTTVAILVEAAPGAAAIPKLPKTYYVDDDARGFNNGSSWDHAYNDLQNALVVAESGDEIRVAQGVYSPEGPLPDTRQASNPSPANGAAGVSRTADLSWTAGLGAVSHDVYFGTTSIPPFVCNQTGTTFDPGTMAYSTVYYWRIDEVNDSVMTTGKIWSFTTMMSPPPLGSGNEDESIEPSADRIATFQLKNGVVIKGGYAGFGRPDPNARDIKLYKTIMSGDIGILGDNSDNSYHVVTGSGCDKTAVLDGFTITAGYANDDYPSPHSCGGGLYNYFGSPTLKNSTFSGNSASRDGGGMFNSGQSNPTLTDCTFTGNSTIYDGGAMCNRTSSPTLTNCTFSGNSANHGAGISNWPGSPVLTACTFSGNSAELGGAVFNWDSSPILANCMFSNNSAREWGGAVCNLSNSSPTLVNSTFNGNRAGDRGNGMNNRINSCPIVTNCIFWDGGDEIYNTGDSTTEITYSDVQGSWPGIGNINAEPLFVDPAIGDYHLLPDSPCINTGDPDYIAEPHEIDLDGKPRVIGGRIDMGAYEFNHNPIADTGPDQTVEAQAPWGATVTLDGSGSSDDDSTPGTIDDINDFNWYELDPCDPNADVFLGSGQIIDCNLSIGEHIILLEVIDKVGASDTNEVTIIVQDTTPPDINCPPDVILECPADTSSSATGKATAADICGDVTIKCRNRIFPKCGNTKTIKRTWIATDEYGNSSSCVQIITVVDTTPPVITCPADVTLECPADTSVEANGSATAVDTCGSVAIVHSDLWQPGCGNTGTMTRTWTATDECGNSSSCVQVITVVDTTPPDFELSVSPTMLWPPDHKMYEITQSWTVSDKCDQAPDVSLVGFVANEGDNTIGDGHTTDDIQINEDGSIYLRSERSGTGNDRVYTITYQAVDDCGNTTVRSATVSIPHDFKVLARIASRWLWANPSGRIPEDLNGDGIVNLADFARFAENWIK